MTWADIVINAGRVLRSASTWPAFLRLGVLLVIAPLTPVHGGASAIVLRYHFVVGQRFAYRLFGGIHERLQRPGQRPSTTVDQINAITSYHITAVAPNGVASASVRIESSVITQTINGRRMVSSTGLSQAAQTQQTVLLGPDNSLPGYETGDITSNSYGNYGIQAIGALPSYPVRPGMQWQSTATGDLSLRLSGELPPLPNTPITAQNALVGYQLDAGQPVAIITSNAPIHYATETISGGRVVHIRVSGSITLTSSFDLAQKRLHKGTERADLSYTVTTPSGAGSKLIVQSRVVDSGSLQPVPIGAVR